MQDRTKRAYRLSSILLATAIILCTTEATAQDVSRQVQLYFFTNPGCAPCRQVEPAIEKLHLQGYPVLLVDTSTQPAWARHFGVTRTPTVVLTKGNQVIRRSEGLTGYDTMVSWFSRGGYRRRSSAISTKSSKTSWKQFDFT